MEILDQTVWITAVGMGLTFAAIGERETRDLPHFGNKIHADLLHSMQARLSQTDEGDIFLDICLSSVEPEPSVELV